MRNSKGTIGILTYSHSINYGACLQTYALQAYLRQQSFAVEEIDYCEQGQPDRRTLFLRIRSLLWQKTLRAILKDRKRQKETERFRGKYIQYTKQRFHNAEELKACSNYDYTIVGSDQVWNPRMIGLDPSWFLCFADTAKKIAYGASFGVSELPEEYRQFYASNLRNMDAISVREESGAKIIEEILNMKPAVVVDPVFLVRRPQLEKILVRPTQEKYVLCYYMPGLPEAEAQIDRLARAYADKLGLKVLNIGKRETAKLQFRSGNLFGVGPAEFVGWIQNAEAIVTNSFHGTAFSLIFGKKFLSIAGLHNKHMDLSSRITDLLSRLKMQDWIVAPSQREIVEPRSIPENSKAILRQEIRQSERFLLNALEGVYDELM